MAVPMRGPHQRREQDRPDPLCSPGRRDADGHLRDIGCDKAVAPILARKASVLCGTEGMAARIDRDDARVPDPANTYELTAG